MDKRFITYHPFSKSINQSKAKINDKDLKYLISHNYAMDVRMDMTNLMPAGPYRGVPLHRVPAALLLAVLEWPDTFKHLKALVAYIEPALKEELNK